MNMLVQYGLAGVVIYMLFKLINNDMKEIKSELKEYAYCLKSC
jgi:hypothetical protein